MGSWSGGGTALRLAASAHEDSTAEQYDRHWRTFCEWCSQNGLEPLPANPRMVFAYIGALAERGTIAADSLQPYLSAINSMHADSGLERPAVGHLIQRARQGMRRGQALQQTRDTRVPLLAQHVLTVLGDTLARASAQRERLTPRAWAIWLRRRYALVLGFVFMGRQDSCVALLTVDHGVDDRHLWLRLTEKMRRGWAFRRVIRLPLDASPVRGHASALPQLARLSRIYTEARASLGTAGTPPAHFFQLPGEPRPLTRHMSAWLDATLSEVHIQVPPGFAYLGHSLRSGGSSAAEAIGVSRYRGNWLGGWSQTGRTRELHYIDPSVLPTPAAYALMGWLLEGEYSTGDAVWERRAAARDAADPGEQH